MWSGIALSMAYELHLLGHHLLLPIEMMMWLKSTHLLFVRTCF